MYLFHPVANAAAVVATEMLGVGSCVGETPLWCSTRETRLGFSLRWWKRRFVAVQRQGEER